MGKKLRVLELSGSYYEMGYQHGKTFHNEIHKFTEERIHLCMQPEWTGGRTLSRAQVLELAEACVAEHQAYTPEIMEELQGTADATGLSLGELIVNNGYTDFIDVIHNAEQFIPNATPSIQYVADNCTAFMISKEKTADGHSMYGQTWDMHATATPYVILLKGKPNNAPEFLAFTITGCVGMIGMNSAGITIGINNLSGGDGQIGVTWTFVIRKILAQNTLEDALACLTSAKLAGAHNYMLIDKTGRGYNIEAMSSRQHITSLNGANIVHTNHCLTKENQAVERERPKDSVGTSVARLDQAYTLLGDSTAITPEDLMAVTRDNDHICVRPTAPYYAESCGAAVMRPATGDFWAVWGLPAENEYEHFTL